MSTRRYRWSAWSADRRPSRALVALVGLGLAEVVLAARTGRPGGVLEHRYALLAEIGAWHLVAAAALLCLRRVPSRTAVPVVLLLALAVRLAALTDKAPLSDDLYRYAWDGAVQLSGTSPYRWPPDAEQLRPLRSAPATAWLWPQEQAGTARESLLNRESVPTIYPPVAQVWFAAVTSVLPPAARDRGWQAVGLGLDLAVLAVLLALLRRAGRDPRWIGLYALAPLPVLEAVQNAHVDVLAVLLALGAVALAPRRPAAAAAVLALAALVKVYPAVLLPLLLRPPGARLRAAAAFSAVVALAYLPHLVAVGPGVAGFLPGYLVEERYADGTRMLLLGLAGLRGPAATAAAAVVLAAVVLSLCRRPELPLPAAGARLLLALALVVTPVQPWYALLLLALAPLAGEVATLPVAAAAYPLYVTTVLDGPAVPVGRVSYGLAALAAVALAALARRTGAREERLAPAVSGGPPPDSG